MNQVLLGKTIHRGPFSVVKSIRNLFFSWFLFSLTMLAVSSEPQALEPSQLEPKLKAVFMFHFLQYVNWPQQETGTPYRILVLGETDCYEYLQEIAQMKQVKGTPIQIDQIESVDEIRSCHILFISKEKATSFPFVKQRIKAQPVVTVSDDTSLADKGIDILIFESKGRLQFEAKKQSFQAKGLQVSSQLLKLSRVYSGRAN